MDAPPGDPLKADSAEPLGSSSRQEGQSMPDKQEQSVLASQVEDAVRRALESGLLRSWTDAVRGLLDAQEERLLRGLEASIEASIRSCSTALPHGSHAEQAGPSPPHASLCTAAQGATPSGLEANPAALIALVQERQAEEANPVALQAVPATLQPSAPTAMKLQDRRQAFLALRQTIEESQQQDRHSHEDWPSHQNAPGGAIASLAGSNLWGQCFDGSGEPSAQLGSAAAAALPPAEAPVAKGLVGRTANLMNAWQGQEPASSSAPWTMRWGPFAATAQDQRPPTVRELEEANGEEIIEDGRISGSFRSGKSRRKAHLDRPSSSGLGGERSAGAKSPNHPAPSSSCSGPGTPRESGGALPAHVGASQPLPHQVGGSRSETLESVMNPIADSSVQGSSHGSALPNCLMASEAEWAGQPPASAQQQQAPGGVDSFSSAGSVPEPGGAEPAPPGPVEPPPGAPPALETELEQRLAGVVTNGEPQLRGAAPLADDRGDPEREQTADEGFLKEEAPLNPDEWQVASPFLLRLWGVLPWVCTGRCRGRCRLAALYQCTIGLLAMGAAGGAVAHSVVAVMANAGDGPGWSSRFDLLHLADTVLALGALIGLRTTRGLARSGLLGGEGSLLVGYARQAHLVRTWRRDARLQSVMYTLAWVLMVLFRVQAQASIVDLGQQDLNLLAYAFSSGLAVAAFQAFLHPVTLVASLVDSFCMQLYPREEGAHCSPGFWSVLGKDWDLLHCVLQRVCSACEWGILILQTMVIMIAFVVGMDAFHAMINSKPLCWWSLLSLLPLAGVASWLMRGAAMITEKCARVPRFVNSARVCASMDPKRHFLVEHIAYGMSGFYVMEVRVTGSMVAKFYYLCFLGAFSLLARTMAAH